jgi:hypothetical protein
MVILSSGDVGDGGQQSSSLGGTPCSPLLLLLLLLLLPLLLLDGEIGAGISWMSVWIDCFMM